MIPVEDIGGHNRLELTVGNNGKHKLRLRKTCTPETQTSQMQDVVFLLLFICTRIFRHGSSDYRAFPCLTTVICHRQEPPKSACMSRQHDLIW